MKKDVVVINIARGEIINENDLIEALEAKKIRAASLDVFEQEPLPETSKFWNLENVYLTPHNSLSSPHISSRLTELLIHNINNYCRDERLLNIISL